jgi:hypothetical protein
MCGWIGNGIPALAEACDQCVEALGRHRGALVILVGGIGASSPSAAAGNSGTTAADDCYADAPAALRRLISSISSASELVCAMQAVGPLGGTGGDTIRERVVVVPHMPDP